MPKINIQQSRIRALNDHPIQNGAYVLYWMQQSQRSEYNHALEYAIEIANHQRLPVLVIFALMENYPDANLRHYTFMMEGLLDTSNKLRQREIPLIIELGRPEEVVLGKGENAAAIICDKGYLKHQKIWRQLISKKATCRVIQVESDVIIPVETVSPKAEYAAYTIRPKIKKHLPDYLLEMKHLNVQHPINRKMNGIDIKNYKTVLNNLKIDKKVPSVSQWFSGGTSEAESIFDDFLQNRLARYDQNSNQPQTDDISHMGPYLHFGQISPLYLALKVQRAKWIPEHIREKYLEQLIVRRELSINFVHHTPEYDSFNCIPNWAKATLKEHQKDKRTDIYTPNDLENAATHDPYWNASMKEMKVTGYMHNYMRMYWAKKILEWSSSPEEAYQTTLNLNNKYFLDGRDPNSYVGVAWTYGLHDRPWKERDIFGKVRYMAASGLERKCDIAAYVSKVDRRIKKVALQVKGEDNGL